MSLQTRLHLNRVSTSQNLMVDRKSSVGNIPLCVQSPIHFLNSDLSLINVLSFVHVVARKLRLNGSWRINSFSCGARRSSILYSSGSSISLRSEFSSNRSFVASISLFSLPICGALRPRYLSKCLRFLLVFSFVLEALFACTRRYGTIF